MFLANRFFLSTFATENKTLMDKKYEKDNDSHNACSNHHDADSLLDG